MSRTISLEDGKYKITRDANGLIAGALRNNEAWHPAGLVFSKVFHAALNRVESLEDAILGLATSIEELNSDSIAPAVKAHLMDQLRAVRA